VGTLAWKVGWGKFKLRVRTAAVRYFVIIQNRRRTDPVFGSLQGGGVHSAAAVDSYAGATAADRTHKLVGASATCPSLPPSALRSSSPRSGSSPGASASAALDHPLRFGAAPAIVDKCYYSRALPQPPLRPAHQLEFKSTPASRMPLCCQENTTPCGIKTRKPRRGQGEGYSRGEGTAEQRGSPCGKPIVPVSQPRGQEAGCQRTPCCL